MTKKKRQGDPSNGNSDDSESSEDFRRNTLLPECSHVNKAVDLNQVKKVILKNPLTNECDMCKKTPPSETSPTTSNHENLMIEQDNSLWMCLKCGNQACGRYKNLHALHHYETPHSDCHSLCVNTSRWNVWCYECDNEVNVNGKKKLYECIDYIKKYSEGGAHKRTDVSSRSVSLLQEANSIVEKKTLPILALKSTQNNEFIARGLTNLGNTCFFNSVMQCLGQTPYLLTLLEETATPGQTFCLPGGKLTLDEKTKDSIEVESIEGTVEEWRPLPKVLAETLKELQSGRYEVFNPRILFHRLTQRMTQFGGGDQHDSHELLRHLLEAVREEDLRRYQSVILNNLGLSNKTDPSTVEGEKKKIIRFYWSQASDLMSPTEQVFRGVLVSTLQCQKCGHTSHREENFLDLSLPISEKQTPPILRRKLEAIEDKKPSKHQIKKERRQAKKNKRAHKSAADSSMMVGSLACNNSDARNSDSESDADVEDNIEDSNNSLTPPEEGAAKGTESGYNSDKNGAGSPDNNVTPDMCVDDSGVPSPVVGMLSMSPPESATMSSSPADSNMGSPLCGRNTPNEEPQNNNNTENAQASSGKSNDLKADLEKLSLKNELDNRLVKVESCSSEDDDVVKMEVDAEEDLWAGTISGRYNIEDGECSVQSCLNQFTTSELMTANNKVGCELCTQRHGGPEKKTVYTDATKQLLIYNPPAVLILHLKRFQVYHFRPSKMGKHVKFPMVLDIAPFCSKRSRNLPTIGADQKQVLYSLYGVVEHSGSMSGGHYVAYVKVRPKIDADSYRWQFLPKNQKATVEKLQRRKNNEEVSGGAAAAAKGTGKWFYVSDSYAAEVTEEKVLGTSAYLLFYERIL